MFRGESSGPDESGTREGVLSRASVVRFAGAVALAIASLVAFMTPARASAPTSYTLPYTIYKQPNGWECGPYATKIALSTWHLYPSASTLASLEGTTTSGTNSITNVTYALNYEVHAAGALDSYRSVFPAGNVTTVKTDAVNGIWGDHALVANVNGYENDVNGVRRGYGQGGHYLAIVAYRSSGSQLLIADPGDGLAYWMSVTNVTAWINGGRGFTFVP